MLLINLALSFLSSFSIASTNETFEFKSQDILSLELINNVGNVNIKGIESSPTAKAVVTIEKKSFDSRHCVLTVKQEGSKLISQVKNNSNELMSNLCVVNMNLELPKKIAVDIKSGSGNVDIKGTEGLVAFQLGSGDISIDGIVQELKGSAGSGNIEVSGVSGATDIKAGSGDVDLKFSGKINTAVTVKTGTGDIELNFNEAPLKSAVQVSTGTGDATVYLPKDAKVHSQMKTGLGSSLNELGNTQKSDLNLSLNSGVGDLKILKK